MNKKHYSHIPSKEDKKEQNFLDYITTAPHENKKQNDPSSSSMHCKLIMFLPQLILGTVYQYGI
jgi:hypothetical protein